MVGCVKSHTVLNKQIGDRDTELRKSANPWTLPLS